MLLLFLPLMFFPLPILLALLAMSFLFPDSDREPR